jgi:hypothetical protein
MITTKLISRTCIGLAAVLLTSVSWAQQAPAESVPSEESPVRAPPATTDANGKPLPVATEKLVLADPDSKMYMPCRDPNDSTSRDDESKSVKPNPKAAVLSEEAAKQHGYKPSPHKVVCPKQ